MFVDIHTHNQSSESFPAVRNLTISEVEDFFHSTKTGYVSAGIHPWFIDEHTDNALQKLEKWALDKRLIAIGECGLDKNSKCPIEKQLDIFRQQITLSEKLRKPLIIHCVGCFNELFEFKKKIAPKQLWIIHGFRGKPELADQALKAGFSLSFGEHFNIASIKLTPVEKLFVETDESKLTIDDIYSQIANIKDINPTKLIAGEALLNTFILQTEASEPNLDKKVSNPANY